jgi:quercetin dioxygenase-like cupin family protein
VTRTAFVAAIVTTGLILGTVSVRPARSSENNRLVGHTTPGVRPHQPGQDLFKSELSEDVDWKPFPAFPPSVRLAIIVGRPAEAGPYTVRVRVPRGVKLMPHRHPEDRVYTVMSGVFYIGLGERFDADKLQAYPPGSVIVLPGNTPHFHWAKSSEYITQVNAIGPLGIQYVDPKDDPRSDKP